MLLQLVACAPLHHAIDEDSIRTTVNAKIRTIVRVDARTTEQAQLAIEYGFTTAYGAVTPWSDTGQSHAIDVLGLKADREYHFRAIGRVDGELIVGRDHVFRTGSLPPGIPAFTPRTIARGWRGFVLAPFFDAERVGGVVILDRQGDVVWYWETVAGTLTAARRGADGSVLVKYDAMTLDPPDGILRIPMNGATSAHEAFPGSHHDFTEVPGIRYATIAIESREWQGENIVGDRIVEVLEDGSEREVWNAFDHIEITESVLWEAKTYDEGKDWTHANGLSWDEDEDAYFLSLYCQATIVKIDRASGETEWLLGGEQTTLALLGDPGFGPQHSPRRLPGGLILFDNGGEDGSRVVEYSVDEEASTAAHSWSWTVPDGRVAGVLGSVERLDSGNTVTSWGDVGWLIAMDPDGEELWGVEAPAGTIVGQAEYLASLY